MHKKTTIDLIDLIVLIHNGPRCELNRLNQFNPPRPDLIYLIVFFTCFNCFNSQWPQGLFWHKKTTIDLIDLIVLIHNGPRCELNQLHQLNPPPPDLIALIVLIVLIHNGPRDRFGTKNNY